MDRGEAEPKLRIRAKHAAFHFFPEPYLELRGKWPLFDTNLAIRARYRSVFPEAQMKLWFNISNGRSFSPNHLIIALLSLTQAFLKFPEISSLYSRPWAWADAVTALCVQNSSVIHEGDLGTPELTASG